MRKILAIMISAAALACGGAGVDGKTSGGTGVFPGAVQISNGALVTRSFSTTAERRYYQFTVPAGGATVRVQTFDEGGTQCDPAGRTAGQGVDPRIAGVYDAAGNVVSGACVPASTGTSCEPVIALVGQRWEWSSTDTACKCHDDGSTLPPYPDADCWCEDFTMALQGGVHYVALAGFNPLPKTYGLKVSWE